MGFLSPYFFEILKSSEDTSLSRVMEEEEEMNSFFLEMSGKKRKQV